MDISCEHYRIFYHVAKCGNITQAANMLLSSQPNVTRTIKGLESALGCTLFIRTNRGVTLTPEGEILYSHAAIAFDQLEKAEQELSLSTSLQKGTVSVGTSEIALHTLLLPILRQFRSLHPGVRILMANHSTPQAVAALRDGTVDFAVVTTPVALPKTMEMVALKPIQEVAVCGTAYRGLAERELPLSELADYPLIFLGRHTKTFEMYSDWFSRHGLTLAPEIEAATADQILPMVKHELGIGFIPEEFLLGESEATGVFRLTLREAVPLRYVCMIKQTQRPLSIAARELERILLAREKPMENPPPSSGG